MGCVHIGMHGLHHACDASIPIGSCKDSRMMCVHKM